MASTSIVDLGMDLLTGVDIHPFTQFVWRGKDKEVEWSGRLKAARQIFSLAEYEMVKQGMRRCATLHISPGNYDERIEKIMKDELVWLPIQRTQSYNGFSHKHFPVENIDMDSSVYGVLARNLDDAHEFRNASAYYDSEKRVDHEAIGELLAFPECCCTFFNNVWRLGYYDYIWQTAMNTPGVEAVSETHIKVKGSVYTHQLLRYLGFRVTSHLPCSFQCEETKKIGKIWLDIMRETDSLATDALLDVLRLPLTWSCLHGVAVITTDVFVLSTNSMPTSKEYAIEFEVDD
jgi:hypothetical protein